MYNLSETIKHYIGTKDYSDDVIDTAVIPLDMSVKFRIPLISNFIDLVKKIIRRDRKEIKDGNVYKHEIRSSSNIKHIAYSPDAQVLLITFIKTNAVYIYESVPKKIYENLVNAPSVGKYFHNNIRGKYKYFKLS